MSLLELSGISVDLGGIRVVDDVSFSLEEGETGSLLGPSGCGKTTLLRTIAGFQQPSQGQIRLRGQTVSGGSGHLAPEHRRVGLVFQDLALFPHLTVSGNVGFGIGHLEADSMHRRVRELLEMVNLEQYGNMYPHELSGGQQQRVALIRAIAPKPDLLLLDEPFSGQDMERRESLAREIRGMLRENGVTSLLVTHDQLEAFVFSDRMGVINRGRLRQWDAGYNLYHWPTDRFIADFIGRGLFIPARVIEDNRVLTGFGVISGKMSGYFPEGSKVDLLIRPDDIQYDTGSDLRAQVESRIFRGADYLYTLRLEDGTRILSHVPSHHSHQIGEEIGIRLDMEHLVIFPREDPV